MSMPSWRFYLLIIVSGLLWFLLPNHPESIGYVIGGLAGFGAAIWEYWTKTGWNSNG